jgi:hypothetical protein
VKRISTSLGALILVAPLTAGATDLVTVDKVERHTGNYLVVTGIASGGSHSDVYQIYNDSPDASAACERYALIAMTHPGRYVFGWDGAVCALSPKR